MFRFVVIADVLRDVLRIVAAVLPHEIAGLGVDGLDDVPGIGHVQQTAVGQRRPFLAALGQGARPDHAQTGDVVAVDLVERAVAPATHFRAVAPWSCPG